jgi:hypothetical protein
MLPAQTLLEKVRSAGPRWGQLASRRERLAVRISTPWRVASVAVVMLALNTAVALASPGILVPQDWWMWEQLPERIASGAVYAHGDGYYFTWSPLAALLLGWVIVPLGYPIWFAAHLAVLPLLRSSALMMLILVSVSFWVDAIVGNGMIFVAVAGTVALRGSRSAALISLVLFVLMPRPLQLPLVGWLAWQDRRLLVPFAVMIVISAAAVIVTGWNWLGGLAAQSSAVEAGANLAPTALSGPAWLIIGIPLAAWLTARGRLGLAGLAVSPYLFPHHLLALAWEWRWVVPRTRTARPPTRESRIPPTPRATSQEGA